MVFHRNMLEVLVLWLNSQDVARNVTKAKCGLPEALGRNMSNSFENNSFAYINMIIIYGHIYWNLLK